MPLRKKCFVKLLMPLILLLSACSYPKIHVPNNLTLTRSKLTSESVVMSDGFVLPMKVWPANGEATAVVLGLHGFNDYSNAFNVSANIFSEELITSYAFDQRGFGTSEQHGVWAGSRVLQSDLLATVQLLCKEHMNLPIFLLGESMGGAVILSSVQQLQQTCIQGVILMAPAVWGWQSMPWWQTVPLRFLAYTFPDATVSGDGLGIHPSDNDEMLRALGNDPLIIKETRIDAVYGLTELMQAAYDNSDELKIPALILYGEHDEIIPAESFCEMLANLPASDVSPWRLVIYPDGYHMLSRDLQGDVVIHDVVAWIHNEKAILPSGQEAMGNISQISSLSVCD